MKFIALCMVAIFSLTFISCEKNMPEKNKPASLASERLKAFAKVEITTDLSGLTDNEKKVVQLLSEAGKIADEIYWKQNAADGIAIRDSLAKLKTPEAEEMLRLVKIWYGPYDAMYDEARFVGNGTKTRPKMGNLYPQDITKEEFEKYILANPDQKAYLESQYSVINREGNKLIPVPYYQAYPEMLKIADLIDEAAKFADNPSFKNYLTLRAKAIRTDEYYESDVAWMDIKNSNIDVVIGPIENYTDALFNYKTAFECVVMIRDKEATKELELFENNIDNFEHNLPYDKKYIRETAGKGNILQVMNVYFFGGDCNSGTKTIAASLPNDPKVTETKGSKKSMYKNIMEAKFDKIVKLIGEKLLAPELVPFIDKKCFTSFVTLHEVSHTLGRGYVFGNESLQVRKALQERYSAIEELKADILGMYNHKYLLDNKLISTDVFKKTIVTYIVGLYRSIRFGAEEAHGKANIIQLNYLFEAGAIKFDKNGKLTYDDNLFMVKVAELAGKVLTLQAEGDYKAAGDMIAKYAKMTDETKKLLGSLTDVPRDIDNQK